MMRRSAGRSLARHVTMVRFEPAMLAGALLTGSSGWSAAYAAQAIARWVLASAFLHPHDVAIDRVRAGGAGRRMCRRSLPSLALNPAAVVHRGLVAVEGGGV